MAQIQSIIPKWGGVIPQTPQKGGMSYPAAIPPTPVIPPTENLLTKPTSTPPLLSVANDINNYLKGQGLPTDFGYRKNLYGGSSLSQRLGSYVGSEIQNNKLTEYLRNKSTASPQVPQELTEQVNNVVGQGNQIAQQTQDFITQSQRKPPTGAPSPEISTPEKPPASSVSDTNKPLMNLNTADLASIIADISSGKSLNVDTTIAEEAKNLAMSGEEQRASKALSDAQASLAKRGMAFSGIREGEETTLAAESLANKAGISNKFAEAIINAARDEQKLRETALAAEEKAAAEALKLQGYSKDPFTGQLIKTLERLKFEQGGDMPTSVEEYLYSQKNPDFAAFLNQQKSSSPVLEALRLINLQNAQAAWEASPGQIVDAATNKPKDLPATIKQKLIGLNSYINGGDVADLPAVLPRIKALLKDPMVNIGTFEKKAAAELITKGGGWTSILGSPEDLGLNSKEMELLNLMNEFNSDYIYTRSGAQINENEITRLKSFQPDFGFDRKTNTQRIDDFVGVVKSIVDATLRAEGAKFYGGDTPTTSTVESTGTTLMIGPDGTKWNVPNDNISVFKENGYK